MCEKRQKGNAKDRQTQTEEGHIKTHTRAGVYIMTQRVQTWGHILRGVTHQDNPHTQQIQNLLMKNATVNTNKCKNATVHTNK